MSGLDPKVVKQMLEDSDSAPHAQAKGKLFEKLLKYVFEAVPGTLVKHNSASFFRSEQIDLAVANRGGSGEAGWSGGRRPGRPGHSRPRPSFPPVPG